MVFCLSCISISYLQFLLVCWISYADFKQKPVCLRFRQRICPLLLNGVHCCKHEKWQIKLKGVCSYGNLLFLHCLKQSRLCLWSCPVYFVCEHDICKDWTWLELELALSRDFFYNIRAGNVRRHQIRGILDSAEL